VTNIPLRFKENISIFYYFNCDQIVKYTGKQQ